MRVDQYIKIRAQKLYSKDAKFRGIGSESNNNLGEFVTEALVDNTSYLMRIVVLSDTLTQHSLYGHNGVYVVRGVPIVLSFGFLLPSERGL